MGRAGRIGVLGSAVCLMAAASGHAYPSTAPNSHDFGQQTVGTTSAGATFTLSAKCASGEQVPGGPIVCFPPEGSPPFSPTVTVTGPFAITENSCTSPLSQATPFPSTCTFRVAFAPTAAGLANGIIDVGDPSGFGKAAVSGTGVSPSPPSQPQPSPAVPASQKKCKKKHRKRAALAKKRKKCRKQKL